MRNRLFPFAAMSALALAACQQQPTANVAVGNETSAPDNVVLPPAEETGNAAVSAVLPTEIPEALRGRWGLVPADCTSTKGDAKGLLIIGKTDLKFYESKGTVAKVIAGGVDSFDADYSFTGEGQEWTRIEKLKLADGKLQRHTVTKSGEEPGVDLEYQPCAA